jgi:hypothetical protein
MIRLQCPGCRKNLGVKDELAGRLVACPQCKTKLRVPQPEPEVDELEEVEDEVVESVTTAPRPGRRPPPPKTRPRDDDEDDEAPREAVRRSRRPRDEEEDEEDEDEPRPRPARKRKKKRRVRRSGGGGGMGATFIAVGVVAAICIVMIVVSIFVPVVALVPMFLGWAIAFAGGVWFLVCAFQDDAIQGILCLFVPFYSLIYLITHFEEVKKPFLVQVVGTVLAIAGGCAGGLRAAKDAGEPYNRRVQIEIPLAWGERPA